MHFYLIVYLSLLGITFSVLEILTSSAFLARQLNSPQSRRGNIATHLFLKFNVDQLESLLIGSIFGEEEEQNQPQLEEEVNKVLGTWEELERAENWQNILAARSSLQHYLQLWARRLDDDKGLATPVTGAEFFKPEETIEYSGDDNNSEASRLSTIIVSENDDECVEADSETAARGKSLSSMKLTFRPPKRYLSFKEQRDLEKGVIPDRKGAKVDAWSPGGVKLTITIRPQHEEEGDITREQLYVMGMTARRCDIDGDTIIKYSSERAIIRRLEEAMRIWKKVRVMP